MFVLVIMAELDTKNPQRCIEDCTEILLAQSQPYQEMLVDSDTLLYHYTDVNGLLGIVQSNTLWATEAAFLSDPVEMHYSARLIKQVIDDYCAKNPYDLATEQLEHMRMLPTHTAYNDVFREHVGQDVYPHRPEEAYAIISFSLNDDSILLWREYADKGNGYALALTRTTLDGKLRSGTMTIGQDFIRRVLYQPEQQTTLINDVLTTFLNYYREHNLEFGTVWQALDNELKTLLPVLKSHYYAQENEARYIGKMSNMMNWSLPKVADENKSDIEAMDVIFSAESGVVVPLIRMKPIDGGPIPIQEIVIGPSLNQDMAEIGLRRLCDRYHYPGSIRIKRSEVPYRSHL